MMRELIKEKAEAVSYLLLFVTTLILAYCIFKFYNWDFEVPLGASGDGAGNTVMALGYLRSKLPWDSNMASSYPYQTRPIFSYNDGLLITIFYGLFGKIFNSVGYGIIITYWLTYPMYAICTYFAMRKLQISREASFVGGIVYAFLPGHWMRGVGHVFIGNCWMLPIACLVPLYIIGNRFHNNDFYEEKKKDGYVKAYFQSIGKERWYLFAGLAGSCFLSIYHGYFVFLITAIIGGICWLARRKWHYFLDTVLCCGVTSAALFIITIILPKMAGSDMFQSAEMSRFPGDVELYGLKLVQLLLPVDGHRINGFSQLTTDYMKSFTTVTNENQTAALGLLLSVSLIAGIIFLLKDDGENVVNINKDINNLSKINVVIILIAEIGGLSSLIGLFFYMIRCYNRVSFLIGVYCTFIFGFLLDRVLKRIKNGKALRIVLCILLISIALFDQVTPAAAVQEADAQASSQAYASAKNFVGKIEDMEGEMVNVAFWPPSVPYKYYVSAASRSINWMQDDLVNEMQYYSANRVVELMYLLDIDGIVMSRDASLAADIEECLGKPSVISNDEAWYYYSMVKFGSIGDDLYSVQQKERFMDMIMQGDAWYLLGEPIYFAGYNKSGHRFCESGMGQETFYYTWTDDEYERYKFDVFSSELDDLNSQVRVTIQIANVFGGSQRLGVRANGERVFSKTLTGEKTITFETKLSDGFLDLELHLPDTATMKDLNLNGDGDTYYGVALQSICIDLN